MSQNTSDFTLAELRYMKMAQFYFKNGQSDLIAHSVVVKLMSMAGIEVDSDFEDAIDRSFRLAKERGENKPDGPPGF